MVMTETKETNVDGVKAKSGVKAVVNWQVGDKFFP